MKSLKECLIASINGANPSNTMGMGNPSDTSGDALSVAVNPKLKRRKKKNKNKKQIKEEEE